MGTGIPTEEEEEEEGEVLLMVEDQTTQAMAATDPFTLPMVVPCTGGPLRPLAGGTLVTAPLPVPLHHTEGEGGRHTGTALRHPLAVTTDDIRYTEREITP